MNGFRSHVVFRGEAPLVKPLFVMAGLVLITAVGHSASGALLAVDVNDRTVIDSSPPNTVPGFSPFQLSGTTAAVGGTTQAVDGYTLTVTAVNADGAAQGGIDDRDRTGPVTAPTLNQLYDDFIFTAGGVGVGGGIDLSIVSNGELLPNTQYLVSIYAFDSDSTPLPQPRTAAWLDGNNADAPVLVTSFSAALPPLTDEQYKFTGVALADGSGNLLLRARNTTPNGTTGGITPGVFLNGLEINEVPEPASLGLLGIAFALLRRDAARGRRQKFDAGGIGPE